MTDTYAIRAIARSLQALTANADCWTPFLDGLCESLRLSRAAVFLRRDDRYVLAGGYRLIAGADALSLTENDPLIRALDRRRTIVTAADLPADALRPLGADALAPLERGGVLSGFLLAGPPRAGQSLDPDSLDALASWADIAAGIADPGADPTTMPTTSDASPAPGCPELVAELRNRLVTAQTFIQLLPDKQGDDAFLAHFLPIVQADLQQAAEILAQAQARYDQQAPGGETP